MSCTVAIHSPVFSPPSRVSISSTLTCKAAAAAAAEETLTRALSSPSSASSSSSPSSSPFRSLRIAKPPLCGTIRASSSSSDCSALASSASPAFWKRKRPSRLDIPNVPAGFGDAPATPSVAEDLVEFEGDGYSVCCKRGRRGGRAMEDRYSAMVDLHGDSKKNQAAFGVFDGHGGARAAEYASQNLTKNILGEVEKRFDEEIKEAVKNGYLNTDAEFLEQDLRGGSCCVTALIRDHNLVVSNVGDCRAVVSNGGVAEALTSDHRPSRADEKERIEALGGFVDCNCGGVWRIQGSLAVSRAIGDRSLKQWVIAEPETRVVPLCSELEFLILASDGLWDKVSTQEAVDVARPFCIGSGEPHRLLSCCKRLVDLSVSRGSFDDVSVMLISLGQFSCRDSQS